MTIWLLYWDVLKVVVKGREIQGRRFEKAELELTTYALWLLEMASFFWDRSLGVFMFMYILIKVSSHGIWSHHFMANRWGSNVNSDRHYFLGLQNHSGLQP